MSCIGGLLFLVFPPKGQNRCSGKRFVESNPIMFALLTEPVRIMYGWLRLIAILWRFIVFFHHSKTLVISAAVHPARLFKPRHTVTFSVEEIYLVAFGLRPAVHFQTEKSFILKRRTPGQLFILVLHKTSRCTNFRSERCLQGVGRLTWTVGAPWSCGFWRRTSPPACPSCASTPARSPLCDGRTPAGPAAAGCGTPTAAPSTWTAPPAGCGSLDIGRTEERWLLWVTWLVTMLT